MSGSQAAAVVVLVFIFVWVAVDKIGRSRFAVPVFSIIAALAIFWTFYGLFMFGDKTGDGVSDNMTIRAVQPVGNDPQADGAYADINQGNARANIANAGAFMMYSGVFVVFLLLGGVFAAFLWAAGRGG